MAIELLQSWVFEVPKVEVVDGEVVDEQFGDLDEFGGYLLRFADGLVPREVDDIFCEGQNHHVEAWWGLEVILLVILLLLGEEGCESELLIVSGHQLDYCHQILACKLANEGVKELRTALDVLLIRVEEVARSKVEMGFNQLFGFEADQRHARWFYIFYFIHVLLG